MTVAWINTYENVCETWNDEFWVGKWFLWMFSRQCLCMYVCVGCLWLYMFVWLYIHMSGSVRTGSWDGWTYSPRKRTRIISAFPFYLLYPGNKYTFVSSSGCKHGGTFQKLTFQADAGWGALIKRLQGPGDLGLMGPGQLLAYIKHLTRKDVFLGTSF